MKKSVNKWKIKPMGSVEDWSYIEWDLEPFTIHNDTSAMFLQIGRHFYVLHQESWALANLMIKTDVNEVIRSYLKTLT